jgi:hypothetical protein
LSPGTAVRTSGAWWFLPIMFALGTVLPLLNEVARTGYAVADLSSAGIGLGYNGPLLAAMSAYTLRGNAELHRPLRGIRRGVSIMMMSRWPLLVGGPAAGCVAIMTSARTIPTDVHAWMLLLTFFSVLTCCAALGVAASWAFPAVASVPLAAGLSFAWINYLPATTSRKLHYITPPIDGFATTSQPAASAVIAVVLLSFTFVGGLGTLITITRWDRLARPMIAALVSALLVSACALSWAFLGWHSQKFNLLAAEPRSAPLTCTRVDQLQICLWPESLVLSEEVAEVATAMNVQVGRWGMPPISAVTSGPPQPDLAAVDATRGSTSDQLTASVALGYLGQRLGCQVSQGRAVEERVIALVMAIDGIAGLDRFVSQASLDAVGEQLVRPPHVVRAWFESGLPDIRCLPDR